MNTVKPASLLPVIAIMGSPNVGKSTLFNRLIGRRRAIVDSIAGVTRDLVEGECLIENTRCRLIDSGGFVRETDDQLIREVNKRSLGLGDEADLILFMLDINNMTPNDEVLIDILRPLADKIILVVNKVDIYEKENQIWNLYQLGFQRVVGISAIHNRNIPALKDEILDYLGDKWPHAKVESEEDPADRDGEKEAEVEPDLDAGTETAPCTTGKPNRQSGSLKIAIIGKPNTGKSTLSNRLLGEEKSIVSDIPGTTRDVIEGQFNSHNTLFTVLDTAGIRKRSKVRERIEYYSVTRALESVKASDIVYLLIDAEQGLTDQDKKIAAYAVKEGRGIILVLNKWDLLPHVPNRLRAIQDRINFLFGVLHFAPILPISAKTGYGIDKLLETSRKVKRQLELRVNTNQLNETIRKWATEYPLLTKHKNLKVRYATQTSSNPVIFVIFVNKLHSIPDNYVRFLENKIRKTFKLENIPIRIEFRQNA